MGRDISRDCIACKSKCCRFIGIPEKYKNVFQTEGVPLQEYESHLDAYPEDWFAIHDGITIEAGKFVVDSALPYQIMDTRHGKYIIVYSKCAALQNDYTCGMYLERPDMCRNLKETTAFLYHIPAGCKYDPEDKYGDDFGFDD